MPIPITDRHKYIMTEASPKERMAYFNYTSTNQQEFPVRFLLFCRYYGGLGFPWKYGQIHLDWAKWFAEMIYSPKQSITKLKLTSRDMLKTYFAKRELAYLHLYNISEYSYFILSYPHSFQLRPSLV